MPKNISLLCVALIALGCGQNAGRFTNSREYSSNGVATVATKSESPAYSAIETLSRASEGDATAGPAETAGKIALQLPEQTGDPNRRIIYTANLSIIVESFEAVPEEVIRLVQSHGGYVSETRVGQLQGTSRNGTWKIRIPVDRYRDFLRSASGLGVPASLTENATDVSEEFVDLEARISSGKKLEEHVTKLLDRQTEKIEDLVAIERELARIRLDIERMEGRMRLLANQVAMSTVNLTVSEQRTFVPAEQPALGRRISVEWTEALGRTERSFENFVVGLVANTFVVVAWLIAILVAWLAFNFFRRRIRVGTSPLEVAARTP